METDLISETESAQTHIECDPEINESYIDSETVFGYQDITEDVNE